MKLILCILALVVTKPQDAKYVPMHLPGESGIIVAEWTPLGVAGSNSKFIFNHLLHAERRITFGTHYEAYTRPVLRLSIGAVHHVRSMPVSIVRHRKHVIIAFWRRAGPMFEAGLYLDGHLVGHTWEPWRDFKTWTWPSWVGARNLIPISDPSFPRGARQHADGKLSMWIFTGVK